MEDRAVDRPRRPLEDVGERLFQRLVQSRIGRSVCAARATGFARHQRIHRRALQRCRHAFLGKIKSGWRARHRHQPDHRGLPPEKPGPGPPAPRIWLHRQRRDAHPFDERVGYAGSVVGRRAGQRSGRKQGRAGAGSQGQPGEIRKSQTDVVHFSEKPDVTLNAVAKQPRAIWIYAAPGGVE